MDRCLKYPFILLVPMMIAIGLGGIGFALDTTVPEVSVDPSVEALLGSRPILYLKSEGEELIIAGVLASGKDLGGIVRPSKVGDVGWFGGAVPVWSPDGMVFAFTGLDTATAQTSLYIQDIHGEIKASFPQPSNPVAPAWSPDGMKIAVLDEGIKIIDIPEKASRNYSLAAFPEISRMSGALSKIRKFRWSPDGRKILLSWKATIVLDTETGKIEEIADHPVFAEWGPKSDGVYLFDLDIGGDRMDRPRDWGGFFFRNLGRPEPVRLADAGAVKKALGVTTENINTAALFGGLMMLSPSGAKMAILIPGGEKKESNVLIYDLAGEERIAPDRPSRRLRIEDAVIALQWAPTEKGFAGVGFAGTGMAVKILNLENGSWKTIAIIPPNETVGSHYLFGFKGIGWTE
jgi:hypothetical protein